MNKYIKVPALVRLKLVKHLAGQAFKGGFKTPQFHIDGLNLLNNRDKFVVINVFRGGSKTTIFNKGYVASEIFFNHEPFTIIASKDEKKAKKFTRDIRLLFQKAIDLGLPIDRGDEWSDERFEVILNTADGRKKCIVSALGAGVDPRGSAADWGRPTLVVVDDLESRTGRYPVQKAKFRAKLEEWLEADLIPALDVEGRIIFLGTVLHKDGLISKLKRDDDWVSFTVDMLENGVSPWASRFPKEYITRIRDKYARRGKLSTFYREYLNKPVADEKVLFKEQYFKYFSHVKYADGSVRREVGNEIEQISMLIRTPTDIVLEDGSEIPFAACEVHTIMDIADAGVEGDRTAMVTCATYDGKRYVLEIKSGYWSPHEKGVRLIETYLTYRPRYVGIEIGPMYRDLIASIEVLLKKENMHIPIEPISHGGVAKNTRIANLQPAFVDGRYYFNKDDPNTMVVEGQLSSFDESADSDEDDEMDALAYHETTNKVMFYDDEEDDDDDDGGLYAAR